MKKYILLLLSIPVCWQLFHYEDKEIATMSTPISSGSTFYLSPSDIQNMELKASNGDKDAAFKLYQYYSFSNLDDGKAYMWLEKSAWLGHEIAQYNFIKLLLDQNKKLEAVDWVNKANRHGVHIDAEVFILLNN